jgi:SAM-dependent methyltransferase
VYGDLVAKGVMMNGVDPRDPAVVRDQYRDTSNLKARGVMQERFSVAPRDFMLWVFDHFEIEDRAQILELGCGPCRLWDKNRDRVPATWRLTLTDLSSSMVESARTLVPQADWAQCDAQAIPFPAESFDAVLANHMLYHLPDLERGLTEIRRVLRPKGKLYATTNGRRHLYELGVWFGEYGIQPASERLSFSLENGAEILSHHFSSVRRLDFDDALRVTEAEPLVAYLLSMFSAQGLRGSAAEPRLRQAVAHRLAQDGALYIQKASGLFEALVK